MARMKIRYFTIARNRDGSARYYWQPSATLRRAGWTPVRLSPIRHEAMQQSEERTALVDQWRAGLIDRPDNYIPGTLDGVIADYKKSRRYKNLADKTRKDYDYYLELIRHWAGDMQAAVITPRMVQDLYEAHVEKTPRKALFLIQVLRLLMAHAERHEFIPKNTNPATRPAASYTAKKGTIWTADDVRRFVAAADAMDLFSIGTAVMLNEWMGQRRGDVISLSMAAYRDGKLMIRQSKTGAEVALPVDMIPELKHRLDAQVTRNRRKADNKIRGTALIQQHSGRPYTADGFMSGFERIRATAAEGLGDVKKARAYDALLFKNLRHTAVTRLAESGCTLQEIASITGHSFKACQDIIDRYNIRTTKMAEQAFAKRHAAQTIHPTSQQGE